jgi:hypothetical protein
MSIKQYLTISPKVIGELAKHGVSGDTTDVTALKAVYVALTQQFNLLRATIDRIWSERVDEKFTDQQRETLLAVERAQSDVGETRSALMAALMEARVPMEELGH